MRNNNTASSRREKSVHHALLAEMVATLGLQEVARRIGYNKSAVCHVLRGTYKGNPAAVLTAAETAYSRTTIACPVLGDIPLSRCVTERYRPFAATNPLRVRLAKTCPGCSAIKTAGRRKEER